MTILDYHKQFKLFLDKVSSEQLPEFTPKQIDVFLHEAEVRVVKQAYGRNNIYKQGYQEIQKRTDDLNTLVKVGYLKPDVSPIDGVYKFPLTAIHSSDSFPVFPATDYMFYVRSQIKVSSAKVTTPVYTGVSLVSHDKLQEVLKDPFNKSVISEPVIFFEDNAIKVDTNNSAFLPAAIRITYIKYPKKVDLAGSISSELSEEKQREALAMAVTIALEIIESPRSSSNAQLLSTIE